MGCMNSLIDVATGGQRRSYVNFIYRVYAGNPYFKDTLTPLVRLFLHQSDAFTTECFIRPIQVISGGEIAAQGMLVHHPRLKMLQVAFFDALPDRPEAVERLVEEARAEARRRGLARIVAGLNGHLAYGVGFLADAFDTPCPFDSLYTPDYYLNYWARHAEAVRTLSAYRFRLSEVCLPEAAVRRASSRFDFRMMNLARFREEATLLGELSNRFLRDTYLYFDRPPSAMYELLRPLRPLLKPYHLLFACRDGQEVGFLFWHPDFNEVIPGGRRNSTLTSGIRCLLGRSRIRTAKLNAVGIDHRFRGSSAAAGLLREFVAFCAGRYDSVETNFVWDSNRSSRLINTHFPHREARHYRVFELQASG